MKSDKNIQKEAAPKKKENVQDIISKSFKKYISKGKEIGIPEKLKTRSYTSKDAQIHYTTEVVGIHK